MLYQPVADADERVLVEVDRIANARKLPHAQVALSWLLQKDPVVSPIVGATKMAHLETAVAALEVELSTEDVAALESAYVPHPVAGFN
jgi:aryl-alcohol dehydrogenase-like predicted oxidoreductase